MKLTAFFAIVILISCNRKPSYHRSSTIVDTSYISARDIGGVVYLDVRRTIADSSRETKDTINKTFSTEYYRDTSYTIIFNPDTARTKDGKVIYDSLHRAMFYKRGDLQILKQSKYLILNDYNKNFMRK